jgi:hypothetical protein
MEPALAVQEPDQLRNEERVSLGAMVDGVDQIRAHLHAARIAQQSGHVRR